MAGDCPDADDEASKRTLMPLIGSVDGPRRVGASQLVSRFIEAFQHRCAERDLPPLDALVVHVAGTRKGQPGSGYFRVNNLARSLLQRTQPEHVVEATRFWDDRIRLPSEVVQIRYAEILSPAALRAIRNQAKQVGHVRSSRSILIHLDRWCGHAHSAFPAPGLWLATMSW